MNEKVKRQTIKNGKGDSPRNISKKFFENFDEIRWDTYKPHKKEEKK